MSKQELETLNNLLQKLSNQVYQTAKTLNDAGDEEGAKDQMAACSKINEVSSMVDDLIEE